MPQSGGMSTTRNIDILMTLALILGMVGLVCLVATVQMEVVLGLEVYPRLYVVPALLGVFFGTVLSSVRIFWRRSVRSKHEAEKANAELKKANALLKEFNRRLEELAAERSRVIIQQSEHLQRAKHSMTLGLLA